MSRFVDAGSKAVETVRSALCEGNALGSCLDAEPRERETLVNAAAALQHAATKIGMFFKDPEAEVDGAIASLDALVVSSIALPAFCAAHYRVAGSALTQAVEGCLSSIGEALITLIQAACAPQNNDAPTDYLIKLIGVVWEKCHLVEKLPKDNRAAIGRAVAKMAVAMKDVDREMDEVDTEDTVEEEEEEEDDEGGSDDDDLDFEVKFGKADMLVFVAAKPVFAAMVGVMRGMVRDIAEGAEPATKEELELLETACGSAKTLMVSAEGLGASLYPPQDLGELRQYRDDILNAVTSATDALSSRRKLDGRSKGEVLDTTVAELVAALETLGGAIG
mmetsp:Transcript_28188/g.53318  ORF Transcript_28188/g.53318 Transcript_28188/m.53318 type:complete len:334 (-) Transcript_28188:405-1406(-)